MLCKISKSNYVLGTIEQFVTELCPLGLEKFQLFVLRSLPMQKSLHKLITDISWKQRMWDKEDYLLNALELSYMGLKSTVR